MPVSMKLFCTVLLFFCLLYKGNSQCSIGDIKINQTATGVRVWEKPEWRVTVANSCICSQYNIWFECSGFQSVEDIDSAILEFSGSECLFNSGKPILSSNPISFTYAWDNLFPFQAIESTTFCS